MAQSLFTSLYWYFFCLYFQTGPASEEVQNQLVLLAAEVFSALGKLVTSTYPAKSLVTDHAINNSHIDEFYKVYELNIVSTHLVFIFFAIGIHLCCIFEIYACF